MRSELRARSHSTFVEINRILQFILNVTGSGQKDAGIKVIQDQWLVLLNQLAAAS